MAKGFAFTLGRFIGASPTRALVIVAAIAAFGMVSVSSYTVGTRASTKARVDEILERTTAVAAERRNAQAKAEEELRARCVDGIGAVIEQARASIEAGEPDRAMSEMNVCKDFIKRDDGPAFAMQKRALVAAQAKSAKRLALEEAEKRKAERADLAARRKAGVTIGMTREDVLKSSWGRPQKINSSHYKWGDEEQWVYGGGYLYFKDGVLYAVQN